MKTDAIARLYRRWTDEPDATFLTEDDVALDLKQAYDAFRAFVTRVVPYYYATTRNLWVSAYLPGHFSSYDLTQGGITPTGGSTPSLRGPKPNAAGTPIARLQTLLGITVLAGSAGAPQYRLEPETSLDSMYATSRGYMLYGNKLVFPIGFEGYVSLFYVPQQSVGVSGLVYDPTWSGKLVPATAEHIDDLDDWHDLIPLMAYESYAITDAAANKVLLARLKQRKEDFQDWLERLEFEGVHYVQRVVAPDDYEG